MIVGQRACDTPPMEHSSAQRGRPRLDIVDLDADVLHGLGRVGLDLSGVAEVLDCSRRTLCDRLVQCPEMHRAYRDGVEQFRTHTIEVQQPRIAGVAGSAEDSCRRRGGNPITVIENAAS
jgi:hypothetical protein